MSASIVSHLLIAVVTLSLPVPSERAESANNTYARWEHGPSSGPDFFPIAVWLQAPRNARRYREAGINLYVGLWRGPTEQQLSEIKAAGMLLVCDQNQVALSSENADVIIGWMHGDEPDNAQRSAIAVVMVHRSCPARSRRITSASASAIRRVPCC